jgi:hypothetical protein
MVSILRVRDDKGNIIGIPAIRGEKGPKGDKGDRGDSDVYVLAEGKTIADAPEWAQVVVDPYTDPPAVEMVVTFADGTTATYKLYGEAVTG